MKWPCPSPRVPAALPLALIACVWAGCADQREGATAAAVTQVQSADTPTPGAAPEPGAITIRRAGGSGFASLRIDEAWLARHGQAILAQVRVVCRYDPARDQWQRLPASPTRIAYRMDPLPAGEASSEGRGFHELPREAGLYWVHWIEQHEGKSAVATRRELVVAGPAQCEARPAEAAQGKVSACVPIQDRADPRLVPDPAIACAELL